MTYSLITGSTSPHDEEYTPMLGGLTTDTQLPDNTNVFWNYTVKNFGNATNVTAYIFPSYQLGDAKPMAVISNFIFSFRERQVFIRNRSAEKRDTPVHNRAKINTRWRVRAVFQTPPL